jgi:hypothetical protein
MSKEQIVTNWQIFNNFAYLLKIYNFSNLELFEIFIFLINQINRKKHNYLYNTTGMYVDDLDISIICENNCCMEDGNEKYFTFQYINKRICIISHIGTKRNINCGYIENYPEQAIPFFYRILQFFFLDLKFTNNSFFIQIWNLNQIHMHFIQYLFLIIRNNQNLDFNFEKYEESDVSNRKENEFSYSNKKRIRELAKNCCESCGEYTLNGEIDHINEHQFNGSNDSENGQYLCHVCHAIKSAMNRLVKRT